MKQLSETLTSLDNGACLLHKFDIVNYRHSYKHEYRNINKYYSFVHKFCIVPSTIRQAMCELPIHYFSNDLCIHDYRFVLVEKIQSHLQSHLQWPVELYYMVAKYMV